MSPRDRFWRSAGLRHWALAHEVIHEVWHNEIYLACAKHSHASLLLIGTATFGPQRAVAGVDWVNDTGAPGPQNWRLAGSDPTSSA